MNGLTTAERYAIHYADRRNILGERPPICKDCGCRHWQPPAFCVELREKVVCSEPDCAICVELEAGREMEVFRRSQAFCVAQDLV